jgi:hypothetical protein
VVTFEEVLNTSRTPWNAGQLSPSAITVERMRILPFALRLAGMNAGQVVDLLDRRRTDPM